MITIIFIGDPAGEPRALAVGHAGGGPRAWGAGGEYIYG